MKGTGLRTVQWWVRYWPPGRVVIKRTFSTKAEAMHGRKAGEVVFQVKGFYHPSEAKRPARRGKAK